MIKSAVENSEFWNMILWKTSGFAWNTEVINRRDCKTVLIKLRLLIEQRQFWITLCILATYGVFVKSGCDFYRPFWVRLLVSRGFDVFVVNDDLSSDMCVYLFPLQAPGTPCAYRVIEILGTESDQSKGSKKGWFIFISLNLVLCGFMSLFLGGINVYYVTYYVD